MTKKHYIAFAAEIKFRLTTGQIDAAEAKRMAQVVIEVVHTTGPNRMDVERFVTACGL
jgi:hypothetical protein